MSFTSWLSDHLVLSSRTPGRAPRAASKRKALATRRTFRPALECLEDRWVPSTLLVTRNIDDVSKHGTLRWAVANAHNGDTILLTGGAYQNGIKLTQGELLLTQQGLTIEAEFGHGHGPAGQPPATISGGGISRIFEVATGAQVTLSNLVITGGLAAYGGGIFVDVGAALTVNGTTLSGNLASYGGGITNFGTLTVSGSTLSGNSASYGDGGGILNYGTLAVSLSTFTGNSAGNAGGGIANYSRTLTVSASTFTGNSASFGGGIYNSPEATMTVSHSTLTGNSAKEGGGIYNDLGGTLTVRDNSRICDNIASYLGADVSNIGDLYQDSSSMICDLYGFPAVPI